MPISLGLVKVINSLLDEYDDLHDLEDVPISVDALQKIVKRRCELTSLQTKEVEVETDNILGQIKFYYPTPEGATNGDKPTSATITIKAGQNTCWRRFVICKELCHCLLDEAETRVSTNEDITKLMEGLASGVPFNGRPIECELDAELLALELLFPYRLRQAHIEQFSAGKITAHQLALRYRIPTEYAEIGMYDSYLKAMKPLFEEEQRRATIKVVPSEKA